MEGSKSISRFELEEALVVCRFLEGLRERAVRLADVLSLDC